MSNIPGLFTAADLERHANSGKRSIKSSGQTSEDTKSLVERGVTKASTDDNAPDNGNTVDRPGNCVHVMGGNATQVDEQTPILVINPLSPGAQDIATLVMREVAIGEEINLEKRSYVMVSPKAISTGSITPEFSLPIDEPCKVGDDECVNMILIQEKLRSRKDTVGATHPSEHTVCPLRTIKVNEKGVHLDYNKDTPLEEQEDEGSHVPDSWKAGLAVTSTTLGDDKWEALSDVFVYGFFIFVDEATRVVHFVGRDSLLRQTNDDDNDDGDGTLT